MRLRVGVDKTCGRRSQSRLCRRLSCALLIRKGSPSKPALCGQAKFLPDGTPGQWWSSCRPRVCTGVAPGRVHCGVGRLVEPQVATPSASVRQYQQIGAP